SLVARAVGVAVAAGAAVGVGRGTQSAIELADESSLIAIEFLAVGVVAAGDTTQSEAEAFVRLFVAEAFAEHAIDVGFAQEAQQAGEEDRRVAGAGQLGEAKMIGGTAVLRVAVRDANVGRVRRRLDQLGQTRLPRAAIGPAGDAVLLQAVKMIQVQLVVL